ncbi:MAG: chromate efflux transporter [Candidatus Tectomicrobia bacterium]|uniref:Chromate efflux transporter n=1 Tax=Tectimicrobiota bacterium TaxID=2528274 RepID=A0A932GLS9_UNCTE|nr:chromate efflux transporter [Candidatus Tectomicrobia bacterium]
MDREEVIDLRQNPIDGTGRLGEIARLFLKLGTIGFGGPAAHIAMMEDEVVRRRGWLSRQRFLDLLGATNLIPGPNSTEMAIHIGLTRAGWRGLIAAGSCFILPAVVIVLAIAWAYTRYGTAPQAVWILYGVKPVIIAIVLQALWSLGTKAVKGSLTGAVGIAVTILSFLGINEVFLLFASAFLVMALSNLRRGRARQAAAGVMAGPVLLAATGAQAATGAAAGASISLLKLTGFFLKIGSILFGSGYVLLAFLRADLVERWHWLTDQQLIDAIAVGQFTPGPVFTTATFIGYLIAGWPGAILATVGIFFPSFVLVAASSPLIPRLRNSPWAGGFLDGANVASLALMATVTWQLGRASVIDWFTAALLILATVGVFRFKVNSAWLVLGGGAVSLLYRLFS